MSGSDGPESGTSKQGSKGPLVVVVGPPGSGKSTVGRLVADRLAVGFRDTDEDVAEVAGRSVSDIFVQDGEAEFRRLEREAVRTALLEHPGVLALGGGAVLDDVTRDSLRSFRVVYLEVGLTDAMSRVGMNRDRPLLLGNVRGQWLELMERRRPLYLDVASFVVATDGRSPDDVADDVLARLGGSHDR